MISLLLGLPQAAQSGESTDSAAISLTDLAAAADLVAVAQVRDTDYLTRRNIPISGSAYLKILIPYKLDRHTDLVEVYEKGLHENECYFPNPSVFEEGRRYLVFLIREAGHSNLYRGLPQGCALEVLVTSSNRYALRYPVTGIRLADELDGMAEDMDFSDPYAIVDDESLDPELRGALLAAGQIKEWKMAADRGSADASLPSPPRPGQGRQWKYTKGLALEQARSLIDPGALGR
jgi:hypothetical protein